MEEVRKTGYEATMALINAVEEDRANLTTAKLATLIKAAMTEFCGNDRAAARKILLYPIISADYRRGDEMPSRLRYFVRNPERAANWFKPPG